MSKFIALCLFLSLPLTTSASDLTFILNLVPGSKIGSDLGTEGIAKDYSYAIEKDGENLKSVSINFTNPVKPSKYVKPETKGFCLVQKPKSHVMVYRYFFFDMKTKRRYEFTQEKELKSILIQDMPGASEHASCTLSSFKVGEKN